AAVRLSILNPAQRRLSSESVPRRGDRGEGARAKKAGTANSLAKGRNGYRFFRLSSGSSQVSIQGRHGDHDVPGSQKRTGAECEKSDVAVGLRRLQYQSDAAIFRQPFFVFGAGRLDRDSESSRRR